LTVKIYCIYNFIVFKYIPENKGKKQQRFAQAESEEGLDRFDGKVSAFELVR